MDKRILIVDDEEEIVRVLSARLRKRGHATHSVSNGENAIQWVRKNEPALILLDVRLPDMSGVEVLQKILAEHPATTVIMISGHADVKLAVECIQLGACDFLEKPFEFEALDAKVKQVFKQIALEEEVASLKMELGSAYKDKSIIGSSNEMKKVFQLVDSAAKSDVTVLIQGESGTGKELVARAIHFNSPQKGASFVAVNCGAIPDNLLESEFFGHEKGAFTGALARKIGKFEQAQGGTLFLDEISELPPALQVKFLRVLQEKEIERVGGAQSIPIRTRIIVATNRDLKKMVEEGDFREDLYYRINVFPIKVPSLRERKEDIPELFVHFLASHRKNQPPVKADEQVLKRLMNYDWPGNIRELENFVERLLLLMEDKKTVTIQDINASEELGKSSEKKSEVKPEDLGDRKKAIQDTEKAVLVKALERTRWNVSKASELVQMSRDTFYRKMKQYAIHR